MPSLSIGYNTLNQALEAFQTALDVTGNNIANVNTPGYNRETVNLGESLPIDQFGVAGYQLGGGVTVESIGQVQSNLLNQSMNSAQSGLGQYQSLSSALQSLQGLFNEPSPTGISEAISGFYNAWLTLAASPGDSSAQLGVQQAAENLTQTVSTAYEGLTQQMGQTSGQITNTFNQIDQLTGQIASLNTQIAAQTAEGANPNSLLDARGQDLQQLSTLVNVQTTNNSDGTINVYTGGFNLVDQGGASAFPRTYTPGSNTFSNGTTSVTIQSGQLAGLDQALNQMGSIQTQMNSLANSITSQVNAAYSAGTNSAGQTKQQFFTETNPPGGAGAFSLTAAILADPTTIASGTSGNLGDGGLAQSIADLSNSTVNGLGNQTTGSFYTELVGQIGTATQNANNSTSTQNALVQQIQSQQQSISGVSLDEEMSNMLMYQNSYESAAKALSTINSTTEDLIQMVQ